MKILNRYLAIFVVLLAAIISIQPMVITVYAEEFTTDSLEECSSDVERSVTLMRYKVSVDKAKVYARPDTRSTVLAVLQQNDGVPVRNIVNGWAEVVITGGTGDMKASDLVRI